MPTGRIEDFVISPALLAKVEAAADDEHRPAGEIVQEALETYFAGRLQRMQEEGLRKARSLGLPDDDVPLTSEYRQTVRAKIDEALVSARAGRLVDGEQVFRRLFAGLDARERHDNP